jgi:peroxin-2
MPEEALRPRVLRNAQLDTDELDQVLLQNIKSTLNQDSFKYLKLEFFQRYNVEIFSAIKFLIWYYTYFKKGQTIGQSIFDWSYKLNRNSSEKIKTLLHGCIFCLNEWIEERVPDILKKILLYILKLRKKLNSSDQSNAESNVGSREQLKKIDRIVNVTKLLIRLVSFINYLHFLLNGNYLHVWERIFGFRAFYNRQQFMRDYDNTITEREQLWQSYFALFKLGDSLFDFQKLYVRLSKKFLSQGAKSDEINTNKCGVCQNQPTMTHVSVKYGSENSCKHVYCYYCIQSALNESDSNYFCKRCSANINKIEIYLNNENF